MQLCQHDRMHRRPSSHRPARVGRAAPDRRSRRRCRARSTAANATRPTTPPPGYSARDADHRRDRPERRRPRRRHGRLRHPPVQQVRHRRRRDLRLPRPGRHRSRASPPTTSPTATRSASRSPRPQRRSASCASAWTSTRPSPSPRSSPTAPGLVKNLNADRVDGKSAEEFAEMSGLLFAAVAADGKIAANRGVPRNTTATIDRRRRPTRSSRSRSRATSAAAWRPPTRPRATAETDMPLIVATPATRRGSSSPSRTPTRRTASPCRSSAEFAALTGRRRRPVARRDTRARAH